MGKIAVMEKLIVESGGERLDCFVTNHMGKFSRSYVQKLIREGFVMVNGKPGRAGLRLSAGDRIEVEVLPVKQSDILPEAMPLKVIYEDRDIAVVDKPAGLVVHPAAGHYNHTMANALLARFPELAGSEDRTRPGIVHRLDKDTSGLIVVAKNQEALADLSGQFKGRQVSKSYLALLKGHVLPESGAIEASIGRDPANRKKMAIREGGRPARTEYKVIRFFKDCTLVEARPKTGRTHQIRVHFSAVGHPVVGDSVYGGKSEIISRQFLHAYHLGFYLPSSGDYVEFTSELPADLEEVLRKLV